MNSARNFNNLKVEQLKKKCKDAGLPQSGNKQILIQCLEVHFSDEVYSSLTDGSELLQRVHALEKSLSALQKQGFNPHGASSPVDNVDNSISQPVPVTSNEAVSSQNSIVNINSSSNNIPFVQTMSSNANVHFSVPFTTVPAMSSVYTTVEQSANIYPPTFSQHPSHVIQTPYNPNVNMGIAPSYTTTVPGMTQPILATSVYNNPTYYPTSSVMRPPTVPQMPYQPFNPYNNVK